MKNQFKIFFVALLTLLLSCSNDPEPIIFGHDECALCKMTISDEKYGAEIVNINGKNYKFDALECMAKYLNDKEIEQEKVHSVWTVDYANPKQLIDAEKAYYLRSRSLPSPMAMFFTSFSDKSELKAIQSEHSGDILNWEEIKSIVKEEWQ
jgi:copper chaperone NosL